MTERVSDMLVASQLPDSAGGVVVDKPFADKALTHPGGVVAPGFFAGAVAPYQIAWQEMAGQFLFDIAKHLLPAGISARSDQAFNDQFAEY